MGNLSRTPVEEMIDDEARQVTRDGVDPVHALAGGAARGNSCVLSLERKMLLKGQRKRDKPRESVTI